MPLLWDARHKEVKRMKITEVTLLGLQLLVSVGLKPIKSERENWVEILSCDVGEQTMLQEHAALKFILYIFELFCLKQI